MEDAELVLSICRFFLPPENLHGAAYHWPSFLIPHYRDECTLRDGRPKISFLRDYLGIRITAKERDEAFMKALTLGNGRVPQDIYDVIFGYFFNDRGT